ncbi:MAG: hypothetical protein KAS23_08640, partial [Anaerohalosphaera sp.]|nr:hypothetical protein [Anaerohalosphaera sp.]
MTEKTEIRLVQNAVNGDLESFGLLCEKYYAAMVAIACSVIADKHLAEDVVQTAYGKALVGIGGLKDKKLFAAWLGRICRNAAKDMVRSRNRDIPTEDLSQV